MNNATVQYLQATSPERGSFGRCLPEQSNCTSTCKPRLPSQRALHVDVQSYPTSQSVSLHVNVQSVVGATQNQMRIDVQPLSSLRLHSAFALSGLSCPGRLHVNVQTINRISIDPLHVDVQRSGYSVAWVESTRQRWGAANKKSGLHVDVQGPKTKQARCGRSLPHRTTQKKHRLRPRRKTWA